MPSATDTRLDIQVIDGLWVIKTHKAWIALTRPEILAGLKRGKRLRRTLSLSTRLAQAEEDRWRHSN